MGRPDPQIRDAMLAHLRRSHPHMCRHWFDDLEPVDLLSGTLRILVREDVQLRYLRKHCTREFTEAAQAASGRLLGIAFISEEEARVQPPSSNSRGEATRRNGSAHSLAHAGARSRNHVAAHIASGFTASDDGMVLLPDYSFSNFVIGEENRFAHAGAIGVAQKPGRAYNPFFIHGGVGLGKTHLLQAICQERLRVTPDMRIYYTSCNDLVNHWHAAVSDGEMSDFRHRFRGLDMLVVDDIHDLAKHERLQEEFFHTFNSLHQAGKQVVLSSDAAPGEIPELQERLVSRFKCGLVARIDKPSFETRVGIVLKKSRLRSLPLPDDVASYIAAKIDSNIRELEGAITSIQSLSEMDQRPIDLELAKRAIGESPTAGAAAGLTIQTILDEITEYYDVPLRDLLSKKRTQSITRPRQVGMYLARRLTRYSLEEIGSYFGGRDHTTVLHAIKMVQQRRRTVADIDREVAHVEQRLRDLSSGAAPSAGVAPMSSAPLQSDHGSAPANSAAPRSASVPSAPPASPTCLPPAPRRPASETRHGGDAGERAKASPHDPAASPTAAETRPAPSRNPA